MAANESSQYSHMSNLSLGTTSGGGGFTRNGVAIVTNNLTSSTTSAADSLAIPVTHRYVAKTTGADAEALTLANGTAGQKITITLVTDGGGTGTLTPATSTQIASVALADAGDTVTLEYVDDTVGWILIGCYGLTLQPTVTFA